MSFSRIALSSLVVAALAGSASAAYVDATFNGVAPGVWVNVSDTANSLSFGTQAGGFNWTRTGGTATDPYVSGSFVTFCIDLKKHVGAGNNYSFSQTSLDMAPTPSGNGVNYPMGATKADLLGRLWGAHRSSLVGDVMFGAFQLAIWEIVFENSNTLSVSNGNFTATGDPGDPTSAISTANAWLSAVAGEPAYGGLYALTGGEGGPQDQLVPTPGCLALAGFGGLALFRRRR
ncbi:MAG: hypothetical protein JNM86_06165 [Phycisphaerae bacterium]|nr:hypothetical protein [Phycisphaerae bacterium]